MGAVTTAVASISETRVMAERSRVPRGMLSPGATAIGSSTSSNVRSASVASERRVPVDPVGKATLAATAPSGTIPAVSRPKNDSRLVAPSCQVTETVALIRDTVTGPAPEKVPGVCVGVRVTTAPDRLSVNQEPTESMGSTRCRRSKLKAKPPCLDWPKPRTVTTLSAVTVSSTLVALAGKPGMVAETAAAWVH